MANLLRGVELRHQLALFAALLLAFTVAHVPISADAVQVICVQPYACVHAHAYEDAGIELRFLPVGSNDYYEVKDVVVAKELPITSQSCSSSSKCDGSGCSDHKECSVGFQSCSAVVSTASNEASIKVTFKCGDVVRATASVALAELSTPKVEMRFPQATHLYGVPEHTTNLALEPGRKYELYNNDAYQYALNSTSPLYGTIPFIMAHSAKATTGVFFLNSAEMSVAVTKTAEEGILGCQWTAEVGLVDLFFFAGPTPANVQQQHAALTGTGYFPPLFSLGYHQCRWNYRSTKDSLSVDQGFDRHNIPYDVLWLDIEHTEGKKYFTWDKYNFPEPETLVAALKAKGRKLVTVKDPHVKREPGYFVHEEALKGNYYIQSSSGSPYEGECWPGKSSWPDFYNKRTREWYSGLFHPSRYSHSSPDIHTWVDMNEPSVMKGPQNTMHRDAVHLSDDGKKVEHRYLHNMYALYSIMSVYDGHINAVKDTPAAEQRPFILTRGFYAGSQRYGAMWTGDNMARWDHLENSIPELLSISVSNFPFCGADVGGFFFETEEELMVRWVQASVFYPFARAHAHLETKRREPWTFSDTATNQMRNAIALRYSLLPYLYTQFYYVSRYGSTIMRPLFYDFPQQENLFDEQSAYMFGPSLLVRPITSKGATSVSVPLPANTIWYDYYTAEKHNGGETVTLPVTMDTIPLFLRGGHIVPVKLRLRRSSTAMVADPYTLYVALSAQGNSHGELFLDDGETFKYSNGNFLHRVFAYNGAKLTNTPATDSSENPFQTDNTIERIIIYGFTGNPKGVTVTEGATAAVTGSARQLEFEQVGSALVIRKPDLAVGSDWTIEFS